MNLSQIKTHYRRDIDGLRAIAVFLVIFFHSGSTIFPSGFIGVDIFFVISGYLITGIILNEIRRNEFSLADFFVHRLWRIQPALIAMSLVTLVASAVLFLPEDFIASLKSAKYNALFLSNQFFGKMSATYASPDTNIMPLLHTWSLSVEWQWYLFLPLFVLAGTQIAKRASLSRGTLTNDCILLCVWGIATASLALFSLSFAQAHPGQTYYFLTMRAFEFTVGGTAFILTRISPSVRAYVASIISILALACLLIVALRSDVLGIYPNTYTLIVVVASALILFCGHYHEKVLGRLLSMPPLAYAGKISYSLYLWHWPVFAYCRYLDISLKGTHLLFALIITLALALTSYYLIENPLRKRRPSLKKTVLQLVILPIVIFCMLFTLAEKYNGFPQRMGTHYAHQYITLEQYSLKAKNRQSCLDWHQVQGKCQFGDMTSNKTALVIGDSTSNQYWGFFDVLGKDAHVRVTALSGASCLTLPGVWQYDWWIYRNEPYTKCHDHTEGYYQLIRHNHYNYVILGEIWQQYASGPHLINNAGDERSDALSKQRMNKAVRDALNIIIAAGAKPIIIKSFVDMAAGYQVCLRQHAIARDEFSQNACDAPREKGEDDPYIQALFAQLQQEYPTLAFIDPKDVQCKKGSCVSEINAVSVYRDVGHITDYASYLWGQDYLTEQGNPFK